MNMLIDYSVLCHTCWHIMKSQNYEAKTDIEAEEFARNLAAAVLYYKTRFNPKEIIFAMDSQGGYWRHKVMEDYYRDHCVVTKYEYSLDPEGVDNVLAYILTYDLKQYRIEFIDGPDKWVSTKLTKAEKETVAGIPQKIVKYEDVPDAIKDFFPRYKGSRRTASWEYETSREDWQLLCAKIAKNLAGMIGAKVIEVPGAEADDIAKVYADKYAVNDMVFITTDSDWSQLLGDHLFLKLFNPTKRNWVEITPEQADFNLAVKLISGDASDSIPAISLKNGAATLGPKAAEKLILEHTIHKVYDFLEENADTDALYRNYELIYLSNMNEDVEKEILKAIHNTGVPFLKKPFTYQHFGLDKKEEIAVIAGAQADRQMDIDDQLIPND